MDSIATHSQPEAHVPNPARNQVRNATKSARTAEIERLADRALQIGAQFQTTSTYRTELESHVPDLVTEVTASMDGEPKTFDVEARKRKERQDEEDTK